MTTPTPRSNREWRELAEQAQRDLAAARAELAQEREKVEHLQVQLAGCGVAAMSNTREALTRAREVTGQYGDSVSYQDCLRAVEREIEERERAERAEERAEAAEKDAGRYRWLRDTGCRTFKTLSLQWMKTPSECDAAIDAAIAEGKK